MCHIYQKNQSKMITRNEILLGFIGDYFSSINKKDPVCIESNVITFLSKSASACSVKWLEKELFFSASAIFSECVCIAEEHSFTDRFNSFLNC